MKFYSGRLMVSAFVLALFAPLAAAQDARGCNCSNPININIVKNSGMTNGYRADFRADMRMNQMTYGDKGVNKHFTDSIEYRLPSDTCETTTTVTWTIKNISGNSLQGNDSTGIYQNGAALVSHPIGALATGTTRSYSYTMTPAQAKARRVSVFAQDDTAVTEFRVVVTGCCIKPN